MAEIKIKNLNKIYGSKETEVKALDNVNFEIKEGEFVVILGASGAGKSTLLNILGGMDNATSGNYLIDDVDICQYNEEKLALFRRKDIGFVFQFYNIMPNLTALENVEIAQALVENANDAKTVLKEVGLTNRINSFPSKLSGGEQQRVAIARAIVKNPKLLLCDEPTGALDSKTGINIIKLLYKISKEKDTTVIIVTHNAKLANICNHLIRINDGKIIEDKIQEPLESIDDLIW